MTLIDLLTLICFTTPPFVGIVAGTEAGAVGIMMIGMGVGLGAGGLAYYAVQWTAEYSCKLETRFKSQSQVVKELMRLGITVWTGFLILGAALMADFSTRFIVQRLAG